MLLSELLDASVRGRDGEYLGHVVDVRFRRGPRRGQHEGDLELIALIVSPRSRMSMYGYERGRVNRPAIVARAIAWMHRRSRVIPWECVQRVDADAIVLGVVPPMIPLNVLKTVSAES